MIDPIKVYVGTQVEQLLAVKVLEYSIKKYTERIVEIIPLYMAVESASIDIPIPSEPKLRPHTPFSFQRFAIPQLNGFRGRAIYMDSDMQIFRDIDELWTWNFDEAHLLSVYEPPNSGRPPQFSVMVLNCEQLHWDVVDLVHQLEAGRWTYAQFVLEMAAADKIASVLPTEWNDLERFTEGQTALVHYTDMDQQPWLSTQNPLASLWCQDLLEAVNAGHISRGYVEAEVVKGYVRPSLLYQVDHQIVNPRSLPFGIVQKDRFNFVPPHRYSNLSAQQKRSTDLFPLANFIRKLGVKVRALFRH